MTIDLRLALAKEFYAGYQQYISTLCENFAEILLQNIPHNVDRDTFDSLVLLVVQDDYIYENYLEYTEGMGIGK